VREMPISAATWAAGRPAAMRWHKISLPASAAVVCGRGARVNACAQAPPDYRSTMMICWWSGPGGWRYGSMPGHFPVLAQTITKSRRSSTIAFERGFQFNWYSPPFRSRTKIPFRTSYNASHWDIGEAALIVRLHCIALGLNQLHPYDGECLRVR